MSKPALQKILEEILSTEKNKHNQEASGGKQLTVIIQIQSRTKSTNVAWAVLGATAVKAVFIASARTSFLEPIAYERIPCSV